MYHQAHGQNSARTQSAMCKHGTDAFINLMVVEASALFLSLGILGRAASAKEGKVPLCRVVDLCAHCARARLNVIVSGALSASRP